MNFYFLFSRIFEKKKGKCKNKWIKASFEDVEKKCLKRKKQWKNALLCGKEFQEQKNDMGEDVSIITKNNKASTINESIVATPMCTNVLYY